MQKVRRESGGPLKRKAVGKFAVPGLPMLDRIPYAIEQPSDVEIGEILVRPTVQEF
jgi:hypothetical protein